MTRTTSCITTAAVSCCVAGLLALGAAAPASAATSSAADPGIRSSVAETVAGTPSPGIDGIEVRDGKRYLVGTGIPGANALVDPLNALARVQSDGRWSAEIRRDVTSFSVRQGLGGLVSSPVVWNLGDAPVPAGATPPPPAAPDRPVVEGIRHADGRSWLVGTGIPGASISVKKNYAGTWRGTVAENGTWKVDVSNDFVFRSEVKQGINGTISKAVLVAFNTTGDSYGGAEFQLLAS